MSPIHGVLDLATNYFRPKHTLYAINYITCRFQNCTGRHWSSSTAVGINWQTAKDIVDVIHYTAVHIRKHGLVRLHQLHSLQQQGMLCVHKYMLQIFLG